MVPAVPYPPDAPTKSFVVPRAVVLWYSETRRKARFALLRTPAAAFKLFDTVTKLVFDITITDESVHVVPFVVYCSRVYLLAVALSRWSHTKRIFSYPAELTV